MIPVHRRLAMGLASLGAALSAGATPLAACDPAWLPVARPPGLSFFVALALADTVLDTVARQLGATAKRSLFEGRLDTVLGRSRGGQRVQLLRDLLTEVSTEQGPREAIVVPWAYGPDCRPIAWTNRLAWIPLGTRGVITGWLRPREHWLDELPTFDVEMAWREPVWTLDDPRWSGPDSDGKRLTPEEFLELYGALPEVDQLERAPEEAAARVRVWELSHRHLADRAPARTMLDNLYRAAADRVRRSGS